MIKKTIIKAAIVIACMVIVGIVITLVLLQRHKTTQNTYANNPEQDIIISTEEGKTEEAVSEKAAEKNDIYILPESSVRYIEYTEILNFDHDTLNLAKNEIYARHGFIFNNKKIAEYFINCTWYKPSVKSSDFKDSVFNEYEIANIALLEDYEKISGYTYPLEVKKGETVKIDLNGDGKLEKISFSTEIESSEENSEYQKITITINDTVEKYYNREDEMACLYIVDIDTRDNAKEICFSFDEPNDYIGNIFWQYNMKNELKRIYYDDEELYYDEDLDESEYKYPNGYFAYEITYPGDGRIIFNVKCCSITEFLLNCEYRLTEDGCFEFIDKIYEFSSDDKNISEDDDGISLTLKKKIELHKEPDNASESFTVEPQKVKIIAVCGSDDEDNIYWWSKLALEDGSIGWIQPSPEMNQFDFEDMFDGVWFAS